MVKNFELETLLTVTTGINYTNDFTKVYELAWFVYDDSRINGTGLQILRDDLKREILSQHPNLGEIKFGVETKSLIDRWMFLNKEKYGETLPIKKMEKQLKLR